MGATAGTPLLAGDECVERGAPHCLFQGDGTVGSKLALLLVPRKSRASRLMIFRDFESLAEDSFLSHGVSENCRIIAS